MKILSISGSLKAKSSNTSVLRAAQILAPVGADVLIYGGLGELPLFNPDLDGEELPASVAALRSEIAGCDGLLICSPEYAHGISGPMKNALDWLVSSTAFPGKPVALINASPRAIHSQAQLREVLTTMSAQLVEVASIDLQLWGRNLDGEGIAADPELSAQLRAALVTFVDEIEVCHGPHS